ncbi:DsbE family thiol:disulfide interchange protein [Martelella alba]|uniref:DsbE family thiol:disulfide interchange protein n=1 Tax=Martelella alba TaxID=2590451 RepID=A0ABY2SFR8_9HYPH|nr:DsbE family thiol:disulfide interchange protein [Martelella alba]TKI03862.1 DsbE family thiol:disulfide interchange protein [Martelella alba]
MKKALLAAPLLLFLAMAAVFAVQLVRDQRGADPKALQSALIGKPVPAFALPSLDNPAGRYSAASLRDGRPFLLNVWATWCPACRGEHPFLNRLAAEGVHIVGVNYRDDRTNALNWLNQLGNPYTLTLYDASGTLGLDLGVYGAPETFLVDNRGIIRYRHAGQIDAGIWRREIQPLYLRYGRGNGGQVAGRK